MKSTIKTAAWICAILLVSVSCYDDGTDCFDTATRISLYPDVELFNADGTTASGNESFVSAVTVNVGPRRCRICLLSLDQRQDGGL